MSRWLWLAVTVLLVMGAGGLYLTLHGQQGLPPPAFRAASIAPSSVPVLAVARSRPVRLSIPAIGLEARVIRLGLAPGHTIALPGWHEAGWYRLGPSPGQDGSAVIIGHVDSYLGPAVFYRLRELRPGDHVLVRLADGVTARFRVDKVRQYLKTRFPTRAVYGPHGYSGLNLATCGGAFDSATRSYLSNVVVYTSLIRTDRKAGP